MISRIIRSVFIVGVFATVLGVAGGSVRAPLPPPPADGPPIIGPCPCADARCLPLCHDQ